MKDGSMTPVAAVRAHDLFLLLSPDERPALRVEVRGDPCSKARSRVGRNGRVYASKKQREAEAALGWELRRAFPEPMIGNVAVACVFYRSTRQRIDVDNMLKHVMDAANGICWHDDSQVTAQLGLIELDADRPRTELVIGPHESTMTRVANTTRRCENCEAEYKPSLHRQRFCSVGCSARHNGTDLRPMVDCRNCGKRFKRINHKQTFCSERCRVEGLRAERTAAKRVNTCDDCGKVIDNPRAARCRTCWRAWNRRVKG